MKTILVFGNPHLKEDNFALEIAEELEKLKLRNIQIEHCVVFDDIFKYEDQEELYLMDVVENTRKVVIFDDIDKIKLGKLYSLHDFDLGFYLKLMKSLGEIKRIRIIAVPVKGDKKRIVADIKKLLNV